MKNQQETITNLLRIKTMLTTFKSERVIAAIAKNDIPQLVDEVLFLLGHNAGEADESKAAYIKRVICEHTGVPIEKMLSKTRKRQYVYSRQLFCWFLRKETKLSLIDIGNVIGFNQHCSVIHSIRQISHGIKFDKIIREDVEQIKCKL